MMNVEFCSQKLSYDELKLTLADFAGISFCGFIRYSNADQPILLENECLPAFPENCNPFLFEAALYAEDRLSLSVRQFNDFWILNQINWKGLPPDKAFPDCDYLLYQQLIKCPSGFKKMKFYTQYVEKKNNKFAELQPSWTAFIGFETGESL